VLFAVFLGIAIPTFCLVRRQLRANKVTIFFFNINVKTLLFYFPDFSFACSGGSGVPTSYLVHMTHMYPPPHMTHVPTSYLVRIFVRV
jgi:hypothetical protein